MDEKNRRAFIFFLIYKPPVLLFLQDNADFFLGERHLFPLPAGTEISGKSIVILTKSKQVIIRTLTKKIKVPFVVVTNGKDIP